MNLDSARNRIKIIEGLSARILRNIECDHHAVDDAETIQKQCRFLEIDLREDAKFKDHNGALGAHRRE